jgi:transposase
VLPRFSEAGLPAESRSYVGAPSAAARKYPEELRDRAVRLVLDVVKDQEASVTAACRKVGAELGINADTLRGWAKQAQVDRGMRPGTTSADAARIRALERENAELRRVNAILRTASAFFAAELGHR